MPNLFDDLQDRVFDTSSKVFGYDATWLPSEDPAVTGRVLFRKPTEREILMGSNGGYHPRDYMMEYKEGDFVGLWERLRQGEWERVVVNEVHYFARFAEADFDGKTYKVKLEYDDLQGVSPEPEEE